MSQALPARPDLDWYKKAAKSKLLELRRGNPAAKLAEAQLAIAREHGFGSWRKLKARVDELTVRLPALYDAIRRRDQREIERLVSVHLGIAVATDAKGNSAIHVAAEHNNPEAIALLLAHKANAQASFSGSAHTALSWALTTRAFESARALIEGGIEPDFFCAAGLGDLDWVRSFFSNGKLRANASHTGSSRYAADGTKLKSPPEGERERVSDALYFACRNGHFGVVEELLGYEVDVNFRAFMGGTPLHWAYFNGDRAIVDLLISRGADEMARDDVFHCRPRTFGVCVTANWGYAELFLNALRCEPGVINELDGRGTPLHEAARAGHVKFVEALLKLGAERGIRNREGKTALDLAVEFKRDGVIALLRSQ